MLQALEEPLGRQGAELETVHVRRWAFIETIYVSCLFVVGRALLIIPCMTAAVRPGCSLAVGRYPDPILRTYIVSRRVVVRLNQRYICFHYGIRQTARFPIHGDIRKGRTLLASQPSTSQETTPQSPPHSSPSHHGTIYTSSFSPFIFASLLCT